MRIETQLALLGLLAGCSKASSTAPGVTYHQDVQPILAAHCETCHAAGGIAPFELGTYAQAKPMAASIAAAVTSKTMPPWPPSGTCNAYQHDRSLTDAEIGKLQTWAKSGALEGDATTAPAALSPTPGLSRVDQTLAMPVVYTPQPNQTDDYRCFLVPWDGAAKKYITGFTAHPGNARIVHHVIAYLVPAADAQTYKDLAAQGGDQGYECFGGPGGSGFPGWVGAWAPGSVGGDFPAQTGIELNPGDQIVLQVHYNMLNGPGQTDQTHIDLKLDDAVTRVASVLPFADPSWLQHKTMDIAAGDPAASHSFAYDVTPYMDYLTRGAVPSGHPFQVYSAGAHMHLHGHEEVLSIDRADGGEDCMLDVPAWNFHWQGSYTFSEPMVVYPDDKLRVTCTWDNTAANQPVVNGVQQPPKDLNWGEGTTDEMCLGIFYVTR
jgi:hypothetical protein